MPITNGEYMTNQLVGVGEVGVRLDATALNESHSDRSAVDTGAVFVLTI